ncbi:Rhamnogalacturonan lyase, domain III [Sesbania bispinosa]|nr:Rhamnogalacturonan lyase, domain III [Sesbania bispinosa]
MAFAEEEPFKRVYGPFFVYMNKEDSQALWSDAVQQLSEEIKSWPYDFPKSDDFFKPNKRGTIQGRLLVQDRYINGGRFPYGNNAYVGLALPGDLGSWQNNASPPRNGPTIWEIGIPDRSAAEFYVPDHYPNLVNRLYIGKPEHKFRQYGLWQRYTELYPNQDLVYNVGVSDYRKDWFYAQVTRNIGNNTFRPTTWEIRFHLPFVIRGNYTLQLALASAASFTLVVRFNNPVAIPMHFSTGLIGQDNAIARHGIHGLHWPYNIELPSHLLVEGNNIIYLRQAKGVTPFQGIMYDYIRLESPGT